MPSLLLFSFPCGLWGSNLVSYICMANTLPSDLSSFLCIFHDTIWVPRSLALGETFVPDDISLIKGSILGAWLLPPAPNSCQALLAPGQASYLLMRVLEPWAPVCPAPAMIDILIRRQELAGQVLPRPGLEAASSARPALKGTSVFCRSSEPLFALAALWPPWGRPHKGFLFGLEDSLSKNCPSKN